MPRSESKLMEMLTGYAAAHQHPFNIFVHLVGIPTIMLGVLIPLSWMRIEVDVFAITLAHLVLIGFFLFYLTLDFVFSVTFLVVGYLLLKVALAIGELPFATSAGIAAACFIGGYIAQFVGHAVERSMPVLVKHPVQANLAAPFFTVVEVYKLLGLRDDLFKDVQRRIVESRQVSRDN